MHTRRPLLTPNTTPAPTHPPPAAPDIQIRALVAEDAAAYKALRDEALRLAPDAFNWC